MMVEEIKMENFPSHGGTPSHLFLDGILPQKNQPFWGTPRTVETSK